MEKSPIREDVSVTLSAALTKYAITRLSESDPGDILSDKDSQLLAERVISKLSIENRIKLYVDVFCSEIENLAQQMGEEAVSEKVKKAARRS